MYCLITFLFNDRVQELTEQLDYVKGEQKQMSEDLAYKENEIEVCHLIMSDWTIILECGMTNDQLALNESEDQCLFVFVGSAGLFPSAESIPGAGWRRRRRRNR